MMKLGKWIGAAIGWALGGWIGAVAGFILGSLFDNASILVQRVSTAQGGQGSTQQGQQGNFIVSLLTLTAAVMKSDGKTLRSELDYVKRFLVNQFGETQAQQLLQVLNELLKKDVDVYTVCVQIRSAMPESARLQLLHYLYGISQADGDVSKAEVELIDRIAEYLNISNADSASLKAMYFRDVESDYTILEVPATASDDEVKKAYRRMAIKYHPDKLVGVAEGLQKAAEEKFKMLNEAYERIKKKRGMI